MTKQIFLMGLAQEMKLDLRKHLAEGFRIVPESIRVNEMNGYAYLTLLLEKEEK